MSAFPGFEHIYSLSDPLSKRPLRGEIDTKIDSFALTRGDVRVSEAITVSWYMGGAVPSDVVWTGNAGAVIVHRRAVDLLRDGGFTGWRTYPVNVIDKNGDSYPDYAGLAVLGRCGACDLSRSVVVLAEYPVGWFPHFLGRYFSENSWDGSDFFMERADVRGSFTGHVFVTERVRQVFEQAKMKNVRLERLTETSVSAMVYEAGKDYLLPTDFSRRVDATYTRAGIPRPKRNDRIG